MGSRTMKQKITNTMELIDEIGRIYAEGMDQMAEILLRDRLPGEAPLSKSGIDAFQERTQYKLSDDSNNSLLASIDISSKEALNTPRPSCPLSQDDSTKSRADSQTSRTSHSRCKSRR